jgi:hypothetical protein
MLPVFRLSTEPAIVEVEAPLFWYARIRSEEIILSLLLRRCDHLVGAQTILCAPSSENAWGEVKLSDCTRG